MAAENCKRAVRGKESKYLGDAAGPMIVSIAGDLVLGGISLAWPPLWIGTGVSVIGTGCEIKGMFNMAKAAQQYSEWTCKCPDAN